MALKDVVERILNKVGKTKTALAKEMGISPQSLNSIFSKANPRQDTISKLAQVLGVPPAELLDGNASTDTPGKIRLVPVYESITAGPGEDEFSGKQVAALPFEEGTIHPQTFGLVVSGDSMMGPEAWIKPGDWVIFEPWNNGHFPDGEIGCICVETWPSCVCKRVRYSPSGGFLLCSDNPQYQVLTVDPELAVTIRGIFVGSWTPSKRKTKRVEAPTAPYRVKKK